MFITKYIKEIFQDVDGGFSMKRFLLFAFTVAFFAIIAYVIHFGVRVFSGQNAAYAIPAQTLDFLKDAMGKCIDGIKWMLVAVQSERIPQAVAAYKGHGETPKASTEVCP